MRFTPSDVAALILGAAIFFGLMLIGASHLRLRYGRRWVAVVSCAISLACFIGLATVAGFTAQSAWSLASDLSNPPAAAKLSADWGANWLPENRAKYSLMLAETTYVDRGELVEYFDIQGRRVSFTPTERDQAKRREHLAYIEWLRHQTVEIALLALLSGVVPLIAFALSRTKVADQLVRLEQRIEVFRKAP
jgi:hypothetical protein